ncbi:MAG: leucine-rich repeat domain-containing protein [Clostridia bacterium]|nr:leucine-rich repeat domain-containing protein [Clostridia bacterium]
MKKIYKCIFMIVLSFTLILTLAACNNESGNIPPQHTCLYTQKVIEDTYKASEPSCDRKAKFYYSCTCGAKGSEKFDGNYGEHNWINNTCSSCGANANLNYALNSDNDSYRVIGISNNCTDKDIVIAPSYNSLPVVNIGDYAFDNCVNFESIVIPDGVTSIGYRSFYNCRNLKNISLPNSIVSISEGAFSGCLGLAYNTENNIRYLGNSENLYLYLESAIPQEMSGTVIINKDCKFISENAFYGCSNLTKVEIPNSVISIGKSAFVYCSKLSNAIFEEDSQLTKISEELFRSCDNLTEISIPKGVTSIGKGSFENCGNLTKIEIPNSVITIEESAFSHCYKLSNIIFEENSLLTNIGFRSFYFCTSLTEFTMPITMKWIGGSAFDTCSKLTNINFNGTIIEWGKLSKSMSWSLYIPANYVQCIDGKVSIK